MINYEKNRQSFEFQKQMLTEKKQEANQKCEHKWQTFKKTIRPDNLQFRHMSAYFVIVACTKCKHKEYKDIIYED